MYPNWRSLVVFLVGNQFFLKFFKLFYKSIFQYHSRLLVQMHVKQSELSKVQGFLSGFVKCGYRFAIYRRFCQDERRFFLLGNLSDGVDRASLLVEVCCKFSLYLSMCSAFLKSSETLLYLDSKITSRYDILTYIYVYYATQKRFA